MSVISVTPTQTAFANYVMLVASNLTTPVENLPVGRRFYPFNMVITQAFSSTNDTVSLAFTDEASPYTTYYPVVDRLNKYVTGQELYMYAGQRRCIQCVYDNLYKVVRICGCLAPIQLTIPSSTSATTEA